MRGTWNHNNTGFFAYDPANFPVLPQPLTSP